METIKVGDWVEHQGMRRLVFDVHKGGVDVVSKDGDVSYNNIDSIKPLPDCTGWDWQPLELKEGGYYELQDGTLVGPMSKQKDDGCWDAMPVGVSVGTGYWFNQDGSNVTPQWSIVREVPKPPPKYRPFTDAWEFVEHAKRREILKDGERVNIREIRLNHHRFILYGKTEWMSHSRLFSAQDLLDQCTFEDTNEPCGVKL